LIRIAIIEINIEAVESNTPVFEPMAEEFRLALLGST